MKVFLTGASGRLGSHIIPHLLSRGHIVTGLVRSSTSAGYIKSLGNSVTPVLGSISDQDLLRSHAQSHDAVIHCAMDHSSGDMATAVKEERATIELFGEALEGSNKIFIMSAGTGFLTGGRGDEQTLPEPGKNPRGDTERLVLGWKDKGIRSVSVRLAMTTHDREKMHPFFGMLIGAEKQLGYIPYVEGISWTACNSDDAALLYVLALESAEPGTAVHAFDEIIPNKEIAQALGKKTGLKVGEVEKEKLEELGWLGTLLQMDQQVQNAWTKKTFDWYPKGEKLFSEFDGVGKEYWG